MYYTYVRKECPFLHATFLNEQWKKLEKAQYSIWKLTLKLYCLQLFKGFSELRNILHTEPAFGTSYEAFCEPQENSFSKAETLTLIGKKKEVQLRPTLEEKR